MQRLHIAFWIVLALTAKATPDEFSRVLDNRLLHLRVDGPREWSEFPAEPDSADIDLRFQAMRNQHEWSLKICQQDVKEAWNVMLNGQRLGRLVRDENDMLIYFAVPPRALVDGENHLQIQQQPQRTKTPDDVRVGQIALDQRPLNEVLNESTLLVEVTDVETGEFIPARITITDLDDSLQTTGAKSNDHLAVRPGIVYTSTGKAEIGLPAGNYKVYIGRGFEYSLHAATISLAAGDRMKERYAIRREVPTVGFVACDTHVHTLTHSGHGDATVEERMITLAAEGIELPIATDHNVHIDHQPFAEKMKVRRFFTPLMGNEVTTRLGHFNVFPVHPEATLPNHQLDDWRSILKDIYRTLGVKVVILNHARDLHSGVRPFGPELFNEVVGENLDGWSMRFNAMEVINSSATQTDHLRLFRDWMALLNRGYRVTPIGCSDSHDVGRHFVGQGRTYIRGDDRDPGNIDVNGAVNNLIQGRVMVSYGLMASIKVDSKYSSGELAVVPNSTVKIDVRVAGPQWVEATRVYLFMNGQQIRVIDLSNSKGEFPLGVKWEGEWELPRPKHDAHLVAIATGPGIDLPYWKTAKPYQTRSPDWEPHVIGCSGAVWLDVDGDGRPTAANDYARQLFAESGGNLQALIELLADYDQAVAAQAAHLYQISTKAILTDVAQALINQADDNVKVGFRNYTEAWREIRSLEARDDGATLTQRKPARSWCLQVE